MDPRIVLGLSVALIVAFVAVDLRDPAFRASWSSDRRRLRRNAAFLASNIVTMAVLSTITHALDGLVPRLVAWDVATGAGVVVEAVACLIVAELVNWVAHWAKHRHPWLWTFHTQHHVESHYSVNLTLHTHGLEVVVVGASMSALLVLCGFHRTSIDVFTLLYFGTNLYKHCHARWSLGPLDWIVVGPAYHRLHHARDHDGNFGSVLTVFDVLFGTATFPTTSAAVDDAFARKLGVTTPYPSDAPFGFVDEMLLPARRLRAATTTVVTAPTPTSTTTAASPAASPSP